MAGEPSAAGMVATEGLFGGGDGGAEARMMRRSQLWEVLGMRVTGRGYIEE